MLRGASVSVPPSGVFFTENAPFAGVDDVSRSLSKASTSFVRSLAEIAAPDSVGAKVASLGCMMLLTSLTAVWACAVVAASMRAKTAASSKAGRRAAETCEAERSELGRRRVRTAPVPCRKVLELRAAATRGP